MNIINLIHTPGGKMAAPHSQREREKNGLPGQQPASYLEDQFVCLRVCVCVMGVSISPDVLSRLV